MLQPRLFYQVLKTGCVYRNLSTCNNFMEKTKKRIMGYPKDFVFAIRSFSKCVSSAKIPIAGVQNVLLVSSAKGGVGKSTVAVNLALSLKEKLSEQSGENIGILDADVFGPSIPKMMGLENIHPESNSQSQIIPLVNYGIKCMSMGSLVDADSAVVWRGLMVMSAIQQMLRQVSWGTLHTLVVDMPPGTGDVQLSLCQNIPIEGAIIVTTPHAVALSDVRRGIEMFKKLEIPMYGIIENMSEYVCPACGHRTSVFGESESHIHTGVNKLAEATGIPVLARLPIDPSLAYSSDTGRPLVLTHPESISSVAYKKLASDLLVLMEKKKKENTHSKVHRP